MCGICGATMDPDGSRVRAMNARMIHRGPDDEGVYIDAELGLALGARRLSIIDLAGGHQPIANENETLWATLNGEIYNYRELREHLMKSGHRLRTACDTEVLVHLFEDYGDRLVDALDGMYAFAIWDTTRRRLLLARDRLGEKPLFYSEAGGELVFASELTALRAGLGPKPEIDPMAFDAYMTLGYVPGERSIFVGVNSLPPASSLSWSADDRTVRIDPNWRMPARPTVASRSIRDYADEAKVLLRRSVRDRVHADVPVGVMLSGGLDSNLIAAMVAEFGTPKLRTFTVAYDAESIDETQAARETATLLGSEHHDWTLTADDVASRTHKVLSALAQPNADPALIALNAISEFARQHVTVVLGGEGADEMFGGYPRYRWIARAERVAGVVPAPVARIGARALRSPRNHSADRLADVLSPAHTIPRQIEWVGTGIRVMRDRLYGLALMDRLEGDSALADAESVVRGSLEDPPEAQLMLLDQQRYLTDDVLAKADRATMQASLEMRSPYLSRDLVELSAAVPAAMHISHGGKAILRAIARDMPQVGRARRRKAAFVVPLAEWLRGPLAPLVRDVACDGRLVRHGWINGRELRNLVEVNQAGTRDVSQALWTVLVAELSLGVALG